MPIIFENIRYSDSGSEGKINTVATFSIWKCKEKRWSKAPSVVLRNTMLAALHPTKEFCIGEIKKNEKNPRVLDAFKPRGMSHPFFLDLASNSRTHGRFTFTQKSTIGKNYYGEDWKRIIYGSILHTGCNRMFYREMKYIIVDDEHRTHTGNPQDDPINKTHWDTGDSHAKASITLMNLLEAFPDIEGEIPFDPTDPEEIDPDFGLEPDEKVKPLSPPIALQFRASLRNEWVAKGTIAHNPALDNTEYDLVIPLSSLKGNKPSLGNHEGKILIGVVHEAEERRAKPGWMLWQWFDFQTLEQDGIISRLEEKCQNLASAFNSIQNLAEIMRVDLQEAQQELADLEDNPDSEAEYANIAVRVIQADRNGLLLLHPYIVKKVKERCQQMWKNLAKAAGVRFYSVMCQPDQYFEIYQLKTSSGMKYNPKAFCSKSFKKGDYIVFCNPMRHWGDVQVWKNKHEGAFRKNLGVLAATRELLLELGRDTDGDFVQLINTDTYPGLANAIAKFPSPPSVTKFPKVPLVGSFQQIAINSMNDLTGVVASLLGRARAMGAENIVLKIPGESEMRIIDFLSQELQIAVDSLKSAYPNNEKGLDVVKDFLNEIGADIKWLADLKSDECYRDRPCLINPELTDTVTRIIKLVNSHWRSPNLKEDSTPQSYQNVLFSQVEVDPFQLQAATQHRDEYRSEMGKAIQYRELNDGDDRLIKQVAENARMRRDELLTTPKINGELYTGESWAAAYWRASHTAHTGTAGLVFLLFPDEIIAQLNNVKLPEALVINCYAVQYGSWATPRRAPWRGQEVDVRCYMPTITGKKYLALEMKWDEAKTQIGFHHLGLIGDKSAAYVLPGWTKRMKIYSTAFENDRYPRNHSATDKTTRIHLFDLSMSEEQIKDFLDTK
ncbi:MAG: hypothetical protein WBB43_16130 [Limnoraphis sp.]